jgi:tetratricopeptide (TPR) repeat protein
MRGLLAILSLCLALSASARAEQNDGITAFYAGHAALQQGDADGAVGHFSKALQIGHLDPTQVAYVHYYRAIAYQRLDRHQDAVDGYTQALALNVLPRRVQAALYYNRAIALDHLANFDRAIKDYSSAVALKPDYAEAYMNRGNAYRKLGDNDQALRDYAASASYGNPIKHLPYYGQGLVYEAKGDKENAFKAFQTALSLAPEFEPARIKVEGYQAAGMTPSIGSTATATPGAMTLRTSDAAPPTIRPVGTTGATAARGGPSLGAAPAAKPAASGTSGAIATSGSLPETATPPETTPFDSHASTSPTPLTVPLAGPELAGISQSRSPASAKTTAQTAAATAPATTAPQKIASIESPPAHAPPATMPNASRVAAAPPGPSVTVTHAPPASHDPVARPSADAADQASADAVKHASGAAVPADSAAISGGSAAAPMPTQIASAEPPPAATRTTGAYLIQIAAFRDEAIAQVEAQGLKAKAGELLADTQQTIQRADLGERGIYYRVQFGPFASKRAANERCTSLKSRGLNCIIVTGAKS